MCGIFGWIKFGDPFNEKEINAARKACLSMSHRGPDFQGEWLRDNIYMGHRRLSIIDLSPKSNQPFTEDSGRYTIIFNGEIYNYIELRKELSKDGATFETSSDTEVLLKCFARHREKSLSMLDGMFAGAIHDRIESKHYIFRDYLGQKPLYYHLYRNGIVYASELRAILSLESFTWHVDRINFLKFLSNSYYAGETTPVEGVKKLLPGHYIEVNADNGTALMHRFWDSIPGDGMLRIDFADAVDEFQKRFDYSCEIAMRSDVPFGVFLSGGIDSTMVLESCRRLNPDISSFSVSMGERDFDESGKIKAVNSLLNIKHAKLYPMDTESVVEAVDDYLSFADEPHGDPGFVNAYFLAKSCKPEITVALAGDGADELFAGYLPFLALKYERITDRYAGRLLPFLKSAALSFLAGTDNYIGLQFKILSFFQGFPAHDTARFPLWLAAVSPEELRLLCPWQKKSFFSRFGEDGTLFEDFRKALSVMEGKSRVQSFLYFYQKFFLPEFVCMHTDRAAMQNSMEVRSPFLSRELIEFSNRLPDFFKAGKRELKYILRSSIQTRGFPDYISGQKKQGFTFPIARWLKTVLHDKMNELLFLKEWPEGLIDRSYAGFMMKQHLSAKRNNYRILFNLMVFRAWMDNFPHVSVECR